MDRKRKGIFEDLTKWYKQQIGGCRKYKEIKKQSTKIPRIVG